MATLIVPVITRYDSRVKAFEVDEKPTEDYSDVGGLDKQITELVEAVVRPMTHKHLFDAIGIKPPKGWSRVTLGWVEGGGIVGHLFATFRKFSIGVLTWCCSISGVLMYGPPGTGKTLLARACAAKTNACFLKLAATQLVQMFIGDGAKMVRDAFALAREKAPAIIFVRSNGWLVLVLSQLLPLLIYIQLPLFVGGFNPTTP